MASFIILSAFILFAHGSPAPYEHVILADCVFTHFIRLSHMAYYSLGITSNPDTVTVVPTHRNVTAVWADRNSSEPLTATFPDGIFFKANLSARNDLARLGYNDFTSFNCWKYNRTQIYSWYNDVTCDAVYDCNHQAAAGDPASINATATSSSTPPANTSRTSNSDDNKSNEIALGVGIGLGLPSIIVTIVGVWLAWKKAIEHRRGSHAGSTSPQMASNSSSSASGGVTQGVVANAGGTGALSPPASQTSGP
ncbi:hypothetical protein BU23DRAFT_30992 [Bimuria novae-zelandiae CBS 107.79]|uniref:Mid2 domain-containing protein n=1 Tax=Bimuria novae-zelandiae CBS 107.79 TaxID=1447943 RepID=A0A6A5VHZ3_9PLEO|nr:hypothetical protein BU23DRAFT_30992 [Bimuria novae-zelandiae CBS 107.79]